MQADREMQTIEKTRNQRNKLFVEWYNRELKRMRERLEDIKGEFEDS